MKERPGYINCGCDRCDNLREAMANDMEVEQLNSGAAPLSPRAFGAASLSGSSSHWYSELGLKRTSQVK